MFRQNNQEEPYYLRDRDKCVKPDVFLPASLTLTDQVPHSLVPS